MEAAGVVLRWAGRIRWGAARFIDDREPSLVVSPGKNLWHCLGACQPGGSVIDSGDADRGDARSATRWSCCATVRLGRPRRPVGRRHGRR